MFNKVFISYAKEDYFIASKISDFLSDNHYEPWLDKKKLLPGQQWDVVIKHELRKADFIILLLSSTSVSKRGYVQREFKLALNYCEEKLDDDIYIIPIKLDDCEVPVGLQKFQWLELSDYNGYEDIIASLNTQRAKYQDELKSKTTKGVSLEYEEVSFERLGGDNVSVRIVYPRFINITSDDLLFLNAFIEKEVYKTYLNFVNPEGYTFFVLDEYVEAVENIEGINDRYILDVTYTVQTLSEQFISITSFFYQYTGGAHGLYGTHAANYVLNSLISIDIETLLDSKVETLDLLHTMCKAGIIKNVKDLEDGKECADYEYFLSETPLKKEWSTFDNFYVNQQGVVFIFQVYQETAYALGEQQVLIEFNCFFEKYTGLTTLRNIYNVVNV